MAELIAVNTGPLIALAGAESLDIPARLPLEFVCPTQVRDELEAGAALGRVAVRPEWLRVVAVKASPSLLAQATVDLGEAAVIQLALEQGIDWVCMDDWKGRKAASAAGLKVTGTLGLLIRAKTLGIIPAVRPITERLLKVGRWFNPELVRRVLEEVGE